MEESIATQIITARATLGCTFLVFEANLLEALDKPLIGHR